MSDMEQLTFLSEEALANPSPLQGVAKVLKENPGSCSSTFELFATSCEHRGGHLRGTSSGKTFQDAYRATRGETSDAYSTSWKTAGISFAGERWTASLPEYLTGQVVDSRGRYRNAAGASTLSEVLEARAPQTYSLSARACEGIIRRAEKRGKPLPSILREALEWVIARDSSTTRGAQRGGVGYEPDQSPTLTADYHQPAIMFRGDTTPKFSDDVSMTLRVGGDGGTHDAVAFDGGLPCMSRCMRCGCAAEAEIDDPQEPQEFWRWSVGCSNMGCEDYVHPRRSFKTVEEAAADWNEHCRRYVRDTLDGAPDVLTPWDVQSKRVNTPNGTNPTLPSGTGEGMNIQPIVMTTANTSANGSNVNEDGACYTLDGANSNAVAFAQNTRDEVRLFGGDGQTVGALSAQPGMKQTSYVMTQFGEVAGTLSARADSSPCANRGQNVVCMQDFGDCGLMKDSDECNYAKYLAEQGAVTYEYVCCSCGHRFMSGNGPVNTEMDESWYRIRCPKCGSGRYADASKVKVICAADDNGKTAIEEDLCGSLKVGGVSRE